MGYYKKEAPRCFLSIKGTRLISSVQVAGILSRSLPTAVTPIPQAAIQNKTLSGTLLWAHTEAECGVGFCGQQGSTVPDTGWGSPEALSLRHLLDSPGEL